MSLNPLIFTDIETTGHDPLRLVNGQLVVWHEIIDFAALFVDPVTLEISKELSFKVKSEHPERRLPGLINHYPERASRGEWKGALPLGAVLHYFLRFCGGNQAILLGQNFFFDWSFISVGFAQCGITESVWRKSLHYSKLDVRSMAVQELIKPGEAYNPDDFSLRNDSLSNRLSIPPEPVPHRAINGAVQAYLVYKRLNELKEARYGVR